MDDTQDENRKEFVQRKASEILKAYPGQFDEICHQLRTQVV
jgi:ribosomal protein S17E